MNSANSSICLITLFIFLLLIILILQIEKNLKENFGSTCMDFIPWSEYKKGPVKEGMIFVSIASYRDKECSMTVNSIYSKAANPQNIFLGICEQNKDPEEKCENENSDVVKKFKDNIRYYNIPHTEAKGPSYARYHCSKLWDCEEYFLQIDSHTMFEQDWDANLIKMYKQAKEESNRPVLTCYPPTSEQIKLEGYPEMDNGKIGEENIPVFLAGFTSKDSPVPTRSPKPFYAAGLMFMEASFLKEVPFDPALSHLFQGEEVLFSARMFTHGYDAFSPNIKICSHHYIRNKAPLFWNEVENHHECRKMAEKKVKFLLNITSEAPQMEFLKDIHKYGLGTFRTIDDFWKAGGIDIHNKKISQWRTETPEKERYKKDPENKGWCFAWDSYEKIKKYS